MSLRSILIGGFSFLLGFILGRQSSGTTQYEPPSVTDESADEIEQVEEEKTSYKCTVEDCTETFESEHGRNVHEGIVH